MMLRRRAAIVRHDTRQRGWCASPCDEDDAVTRPRSPTDRVLRRAARGRSRGPTPGEVTGQSRRSPPDAVRACRHLQPRRRGDRQDGVPARLALGRARPAAGRYHPVPVPPRRRVHLGASREPDGGRHDLRDRTRHGLRDPTGSRWVVGDEAWGGFDVAGVRSFARADAQSQRVRGAVLFTDIVDSTALRGVDGAGALARARRHAQRAGPVRAGPVQGPSRQDHWRWRALFDGSERAVRAAAAIGQAVRPMGLTIRAGIHTGEVEVVAGDVRGLAVHVAARVMALAGPGRSTCRAGHGSRRGSGSRVRRRRGPRAQGRVRGTAAVSSRRAR